MAGTRLAEAMLGRVEAMPQFEFRGAEDPTSSAVYRAGKTPVTSPSHNSARHVSTSEGEAWRLDVT